MTPNKSALIWLFTGLIRIMEAQTLLSNPVDFVCRDCKPADALVALSKQSGINIVFSNRFFEDCPALQLEFKQEPLEQILQSIIPCGRVNYRLLDDQIVVYRKLVKHTLSGYVQDAETGERLIGAGVRVLQENPEQGARAITNEFGFFSLKLEEGAHMLQISYVGYQSQQLPVEVLIDKIIRVRLKSSSLLQEVLVSANAEQETRESKSGSPVYLDLKGLRALPMPGGEADLLRQTALQSGIQTGADGLGGLHVRGGNADQNLFLLDDVPVYSPSHALGLFSIYNPSTVSSVRLWKGDFPARYSGRASSVLDVRTRDGDSQRFRSEVSTGLFAASALTEGPLKKDKGSFLLGGRMTYFDPWVDFFSKRGNLLTFSGDDIKYRFFDLNLKLNYTIGDHDRVFFSLYQGGDLFQNAFIQNYDDPNGYITDESKLKTDWGNNIAALRWNHLLRENLFTNTTLRYSRFFYQSTLAFKSNILYPNGKQFVLADYGQSYQTLIRDWSGKTDFTFYTSEDLTLRWGFSFTSHGFQPGALSANFLQPGQTQENVDSLANILLNNERLDADETEGYIDAEWDFGKYFRLESGLNGSVFQTKNTNYRLLQPRIRLRRDAPSGWSQWVGWHRMAQNLHQIGTFNVSLPFELWVPSTRRVPPEIVWQTSAGIGFKRGKWAVQLEAYTKKMPRVLTFIAANDALLSGGAVDASGWEDRIAVGSGSSRGLEFNLEKTKGRFRGSLAYTLSQTERFFPDLNAGRPFPFRFDRRHDLKITLRQQIVHWLEADLIWAVASGNPITLAGVKFLHQSVEGDVARDVYFYTEVNGYRLPTYHRLDAALNAHWEGKHFRHGMQIGVYNMYNRDNPFYLYVDAGSSVRGKAIQFTLLPVLPAFRYELKF
ncbi:MAG TPA: TonB-dependent receptor [Saprospiraceae bacterium]|nr:TonB-dependent receptor [Saprospiraceae bacterium]